MARVHPRLLVIGALALLLSIRLAPIVASDFPLGAGGLFVVMAHDLREGNFSLPAFTTYNDGTIPFAYPPLGLYLVALIPGDPIDTLRWLPLLYSLISVAGTWLLARELAGQRVAVVAVMAFAAMPNTWVIEGGGVTRGLGFALLVLMLWRVAVLLRDASFTNAVSAGVLGGLALLSHPSVGPTAAASVLLFVVFRPSFKAVLLAAGAIVAGALVVMPWIITVTSVHGLDPFIHALGAHVQAPALVRLLAFGPSWLGALDPILPTAIIGAAILLRRGAWLIPAWLVLLFVVPGGDGRYAALPWAILAAEGGLLVWDALRPTGAHGLAAGAVLVLLLAASLVASYQRFQPVPAGVRAAMADGPPNPTRADDPAVEWYPALTGQVHPAAYFGYEWTDTWDDRLAKYRALLP